MLNVVRSGMIPLLLLVFLPGTLQAQVGHTLRAGDEVRVHAPGVRSGRLRGTVVLYQGSVLELRDARSGTVVSVPVERIRALARYQGIDRGRSSWRMARVGGFVGGAAGFVSGPLIATTRAPGRFGEVMLVSGIVGTLAGAGAGAALGSLFPQEQWQRFRMPIVPTLSAGAGGYQVGVTASLP